tara:strand:+ start:8931 stop:10385 length:1455 start_codon:yes stop_codon:yes gene_type:complete
MAIFKFDDNDVFINTLESYPEYSFYIVNGSVYIDNQPNLSGSHDNHYLGALYSGAPVLGVPEGYISLYEKNINRGSGSIIYPLNPASSSHFVDTEAITKMGPESEYQIGSRRQSETDATGSLIRAYVIKDGPKNSIKVVDNPTYNTAYQFGDRIETRYKLSASISQFYYATQTGNRLTGITGRIPWGIKQYSPGEGNYTYTVPYSIQGILDKYSHRSPHFKMVTEAPLPVRDLAKAEMCLIDIPSIFYGKKIKPGTVELNYFISGSLIGTLKDRGQNGELIQTFLTSSSDPRRPNTSGSVQGIVLYSEGVIILTGSYEMADHGTNEIVYIKNDGTATGNERNKWTHFGSGMHQNLPASNVTLPSASFEIKYQGISQTPTMMVMAHAKYGQLNWSNNPTYLKQGDLNLDTSTISNYRYVQQDVKITNTGHTILSGSIPVEQKRETYITKVAIYDDKRNLIGVAALANPVRKTEDRQYTFKLKLDL